MGLALEQRITVGEFGCSGENNLVGLLTYELLFPYVHLSIPTVLLIF